MERGDPRCGGRRPREYPGPARLVVVRHLSGGDVAVRPRREVPAVALTSSPPPCVGVPLTETVHETAWFGVAVTGR